MSDQTSARGSLRREGPSQPDPEEKENLRAIVDGDPELQQLLEGGPKPIEMLVERDSPTDEEPKVSVGKPVEKAKEEERFPWDESSPPSAPEPPVVPKNGAAKREPADDVAPEAAEVLDEEKPYVCRFYWENDPDTFSANALLFGKVSDVAILFGDIRIRYRSLKINERNEIDDYMPKLQDGGMSIEKLNDEKAMIRLAMVVTHIQGRPYGETVPERVGWLRKLPEELIMAMHQAAVEYQVRLALRLRGVQEQLKN